MSEPTKPWWDSGAARGVDAPMVSTGTGGTRNLRFWLKQGERRKIVFLTDSAGDAGPPPPIWEHNFKLNGHWQNWVTCLEPLRVPCPLCAWAAANGKAKRYQAMFFTIIDTTEFTDKKGVVRSNERRLICAKNQTVELFRLRVADLSEMEPPKSLRGSLFRASRTEEDKSPSVGNDYAYLGHTDMDRFDETAQLDYLELLRPDPEKVVAVVAALNSGGGMPAAGGDDRSDGSGSHSDGGGDDIPF